MTAVQKLELKSLYRSLGYPSLKDFFLDLPKYLYRLFDQLDDKDNIILDLIDQLEEYGISRSELEEKYIKKLNFKADDIYEA